MPQIIPTVGSLAHWRGVPWGLAPHSRRQGLLYIPVALGQDCTPLGMARPPHPVLCALSCPPVPLLTWAHSHPYPGSQMSHKPLLSTGWSNSCQSAKALHLGDPAPPMPPCRGQLGGSQNILTALPHLLLQRHPTRFQTTSPIKPFVSPPAPTKTHHTHIQNTHKPQIHTCIIPHTPHICNTYISHIQHTPYIEHTQYMQYTHDTYHVHITNHCPHHHHDLCA